MKLAILGCGNIGGSIARSLQKQGLGVNVVAVYDIDRRKAESLAAGITPRPVVCRNVDELVKNKEATLVLEAASQEAVALYGKKILCSGKSLMVMSVGAFSDDALLKEMKESSEKKKVKIFIPSGAVAGIDGLKSALIGGVTQVTLTTRKNPKNLDVAVKKETVLYEGPAREGIKKYPKNVNVAATLSLAGIGLDKTLLRIIADPKTEKNTHEIVVVGAFGRFSVMLENTPSPDNPKTSYLAILSAMATLKKLSETVEIGT
ncbi:MAG: aspartate dehydrogenase [Candidatus Altiarchaeia archaeon]